MSKQLAGFYRSRFSKPLILVGRDSGLRSGSRELIRWVACKNCYLTPAPKDEH